MMDDRKKHRIKIWSYIPLLAYTLCSTYYIILLRPLIHRREMDDHLSINTITAHHFGSLTLFITLATIIAGIVYFYYLFHLIKLRDMPRWTKMGWIVFLTFFGAFAFPVIWHQLIRIEPKNVRLNASIG